MNEHMPGPWRWGSCGLVLMSDGQNEDVVFYRKGLPLSNLSPNLRLVAAAPDLLAACEMAIIVLGRMPLSEAEKAVRAAIDKAKGDD